MLPLMVTLIILFDILQYNSNIFLYYLFNVLVILFLSKILSFNIINTIVIILLTNVARSRFMYEDNAFFSLYLGPLKYLIIMIMIFSFIYYNRGLSQNMLIVCLYFVLCLVNGILNEGSYYHMVSDITQYILFFILPFIVYKLLNYSTAFQISKTIDVYFTVIPLSILLLFLFSRTHFTEGSHFVIIGPIILFSAILNLHYCVTKNNKIAYFINYLIAIYLLFNAPNSLQILLLIILSFLVFITNMKINLKNLLPFTISLLVMFLISLNISDINLSNLKYLKLKLVQLYSLIDLITLNTYILPNSVQIRLHEFMNIITSFNFSEILLGRGFGGYFTDNNYPFLNLNETAFSDEEIGLGKFYSTHSFLSNILLKYGLLGILLYFSSSLYIFRRIECVNPRLALLTFFIFFSFWGVKSTIIIGLYLSCKMTLKNSKYFIKNYS